MHVTVDGGQSAGMLTERRLAAIEDMCFEHLTKTISQLFSTAQPFSTRAHTAESLNLLRV